MVNMNRFDSVSLSFFLANFKTSACNWLVPPKYDTSPPIHVPASDSEKRRDILQQFLLWLVQDVLVPFLGGSFYITDSGPHKNRMFYFRHDDWAAMAAPTICSLGTATYERIRKSQAFVEAAGKVMMFGVLRLLPKDSGARPILNLRKRFWKKTKDGPKFLQSVNATLQNLIYEKFKEYSLRSKGPRMYFVKVDVVKCFDNIDQQYAKKIVEAVIREHEYVVKKYAVVYNGFDGAKRTFVRKARPS
ncbi:hypothetical protein HK405_009849, partial [Cladochytrium tenue]